MSLNLKAAAVAAGALALAACGATTFNTTWKAPDAKPLTFKKGDKVIAMVVSPDEAVRRGAEADLAAELTRRGLEGVSSWTVIPTEVVEKNDKEKAKELVEASGAKGVVAMRVTGKDKEITGSGPTYAGVPMWGAPYYGGFWGGWYGYGWGAAYSPGYLRTDTLVYVETLVYDLNQNKLVWAGQSKTTNPSKAQSFIRELVDGAAKEMKKAGLIP
jgi:hypothetical protein